jgi:hypothetical protein
MSQSKTKQLVHEIHEKLFTCRGIALAQAAYFRDLRVEFDTEQAPVCDLLAATMNELANLVDQLAHSPREDDAASDAEA